MKLTTLLILLSIGWAYAGKTYSQTKLLNLSLEKTTVKEVISKIEDQSEFYFMYSGKLIDVDREVSVDFKNQKIDKVLTTLFEGTDVEYVVKDRFIVLTKEGTSGDFSSSVQQNAITGSVTDESGEPLPGVTIVVKGTTKGTVSDVNGKFNLANISATDVIQFSFVGMLTQEVEVGSEREFNIIMKADAIGLEEVVAIGYGTIKKSDITGSVSSVKISDLQEGVTNSVDQMLIGKSAGVNVVQNSGEPGGGISINIRGASSINAGNSPLYVIDGLPIDNSRAVDNGSISAFGANRSPRSPLASINPSDIESIEILKDASATAIYGSRGANGVILITTKSGTNENMKVSYQGYLGIQNRARKLDLLSAQDYKKVINEIIAAGGDSEESLVGDIANGGKGTDWQDELNNENALVHDHQLAFSGGTKKTSYYISLNYMDQEGIMKNTDFSRYGARINLKSDISDKFNIGFNATGTYTQDNFIANGFGINEWAGPLYAAYNFDPTLPVFDDNGEYALSPFLTVDNPVAVSEGMSSVSNTNRIMASMYGEYHFTSNFFAKLNVGGDFVNESRKSFISSLTKAGRNNAGIAANQNVEKSNYLVEGTVHYSKTFDIHSINVMAGTTYQRFVTNGLSNQASGFPNESLGANSLGIGDQSTFGISNYLTGNRLASYIGRVNYSLNDKYLVTATIRADGSSRFGTNNKFGYFPSTAFAWKVSNEDFIQEIDFISNLKVRASWGQTGNQEIGNFPSLSTFGSGQTAIWNESPVTGTRPLRIPNPDLKWETTEQINVGLDFGLFNSRVSGSIDYFKKKTTDMLLDLPIPQSTGFNSILSNVGRIDNRGFELSVNTVNITTQDFSWRTDLTFTTMKNEVKDLGGMSEIIVGAGYTHVSQVAIIKPGLPLNSYYGWAVDGIWQQGDDFSQSTEDYQPGDLKYVDQDGDKVITDKDRVVIGNSFPDFQWSMGNTFSFKDFSLFVFIEGVEGVDMLNGNLIDNYFPINFRRNKFAEPYLNRWTPGNPTNEYPSFVDPLKFGRRVANTHTLLDASYIRLKTVRLSYNLPQINRFIKSAQIYVTGENLYTMTDYIGLDPAVNPNNNPNFRIDFNAYPSARTLIFGVKLDF
ncbi:TonB-dependent receptor [uncultured Draconibacterium sp.]|uniref:TonB-dependent receptor n=1 Tax=uncultured Draconibacterium sp. TaxID=1573823 RepID=UPI0029C67622|nr:TonB-dependent receptor [uncultured Draconibacterium sp.]